MPAGMGYGGGGNIIDLRGAPTGLEELGVGLAQLVGALSGDPKDKIRAALLSDPQLAKQAGTAYREWADQLHDLPSGTLQQLGDARQPGAPGIANPGGGVIPIEVMEEMSRLFPATREEEVDRALRKVVTPEAEAAARARPIQVENARAGQMTPDEEAAITTTALRTQGTQATLAGRQAEREIDVLGAVERAGFTAEQEGELRAAAGFLDVAKVQLEGMGVMIDQAGMDQFAKMYAEASPQDRQLITLGISGPRGAYLAQRLLNSEQFDRQVYLTNLQNAKTPEEILTARFELKTKIRNERDRLIGQLEEAPDDQLPGIIEDINSLADDLLRVDPGAVAQIAIGDPGLVGTDPERARFGIKTYLQTLDGADKMEVNAQILSRQGLSQQSVTQLREALTDATGQVNEIMFAGIMERATQIRTAQDEETNRVAIQSILELGSNEATREMLSPRLATELDSAIARGDTPKVVANLLRETQLQRQYEFYRQVPQASSTRVAPRQAAGEPRR